ncbi:MAG: hypothetical protein RLZZ540_270 [Bacteroidota bacterium]|jgi:hypothetical protein
MDKVDIESLERKAGNTARTELKTSVLSQIKRTFHKRSGDLEKSNVNARYKAGLLDRLVLNMPRYSFQSHFGSAKTGTQKASQRQGGAVKSFQRHLKGKTVEVAAHQRAGGTVQAFNKNRSYKAYNHIARALQQTKALDNLATSLGNNRAVQITSQIDF